MEKASLQVALAAVFYGFIAVGVRMFSGFGFSAYETAFYSFVAGTVLVAPFLFVFHLNPFKKQSLFFSAGYGLIGALLQLSSFGAIALGVPIAAAVLLLYSEPIWTLFFAKHFLGEPLSRKKLSAAALSLIGVAVVVGGEELLGISLLGLIFALLSGVFLSLWVIYARESDLHHQPHLTTTFVSIFYPIPWLLLTFPFAAALFPGTAVASFSSSLSAETVFLFFLFAAAAYVIPDLLFYSGLDRMPASQAGLIMPLEPIAAALLAAFFFSEPLTWNVLLGGALILSANYVTYVRRKPHRVLRNSK